MREVCHIVIYVLTAFGALKTWDLYGAVKLSSTRKKEKKKDQTLNIQSTSQGTRGVPGRVWTLYCAF